jgi:hypothetical protein
MEITVTQEQGRVPVTVLHVQGDGAGHRPARPGRHQRRDR